MEEQNIQRMQPFDSNSRLPCLSSRRVSQTIHCQMTICSNVLSYLLLDNIENVAVRFSTKTNKTLKQFRINRQFSPLNMHLICRFAVARTAAVNSRLSHNKILQTTLHPLQMQASKLRRYTKKKRCQK